MRVSDERCDKKNTKLKKKKKGDLKNEWNKIIQKYNIMYKKTQKKKRQKQ